MSLGDIDSNSSSVHCQNVTDPLGWLIRPSATPRHYIDGISVLCRIITYEIRLKLGGARSSQALSNEGVVGEFRWLVLTG
jgi:hypothetical protein